MVYCCIVGCKSRSERKEENITFHSFPKDADVRLAWIISTGRLNWAPKKHNRICSKHFEKNCLHKAKHNTYLNAFSIPTKRVHNSAICNNSTIASPKTTSVSATSTLLEESVKSVVTSETASDANRPRDSPVAQPVATLSETMRKIDPLIKEMDCSGDPKNNTETLGVKSLSSEIACTPRKKKLSKKLILQTRLAEYRKKKIALLKSQNRRLQKKNVKLTDIIDNLKSNFFINQETADLLSNMIPQNKNFLKATSKYSPDVRKFALNLHFISPRAYHFVRKTFNTCLPHVRTLARWYQTVDGEPGFSRESLEALKLLVKTKPSQKLFCALSFDEMAIRRAIEWNGEHFTGFVNYGHHSESDNLPVAKEALVFMLTCLNGSWKLPVGYFLVDGVTAEQKTSLVKTCIDLISECDLNVVSLTFDGTATNFSMAKLLGCNFEGDVNPVFLHKGKQIVVFPDPSHMLKLVRNTLGDKMLIVNGEGDSISWNFIKLLVDLQENEGFHLANKIRSAHINYKNQVMKVKLAAQLFSESVADSIEFCRNSLLLEQFKDSLATIDFIRQFNNLFDVMNTRNLKAFAYKQPIMRSNFETIKSFLLNTYNYIKSLKIGTINVLNSNRKTGFLGFMLCIQAVLFLYKSLIEENSLEFLSTYKLSQDHLEIFFSAIRAKGGFNNNPTATQFKSAYKRLLVHGELKHLVSGNCIPLDDIHILSYNKPELAINKTTERHTMIEDSQENVESEIIIANDHDYLADPTRLTEFSKQVITYIAGFIIKAMEKQIKCEYCLACLYSPIELENSLQFKKDKGGLRYPSLSLVKLCNVAEQVYRKNKHNGKIVMHHLLQDSMKKCVGLKLFPEDSHSSANQNHYSLLIKAILKKYLNVRLHYAVKRMVNKGESVRNVYTKLILFKGQ